MDIRRLKVWLLGADESISLDPRQSRPDCICLPVAGESDIEGRVASLRSLLPALPVFLICEPISKAYNVADFSAAAKCAPDGIILRGVENAARIQMAETLLRVAEAREGLRENSIALIAMIGDNCGGLLNARHFVHRLGRLIALGYDAGPLGTEQGSGEIIRHGAVATLLAARNLGIPAIDFTAPGSAAATFKSDCDQAARTGFAGKLTGNPAHIGIVQSAFAAA